MDISKKLIKQVIQEVIAELTKENLESNLNSKLLTQEDLAKRWQVSIKAIENYRKDGLIAPVKGIKAIRFNTRYIEEIEGTIPEPVTWAERKLQLKVESLEKENEKLKALIANILAECTTALYNKI